MSNLQMNMKRPPNGETFGNPEVTSVSICICSREHKNDSKLDFTAIRETSRIESIRQLTRLNVIYFDQVFIYLHHSIMNESVTTVSNNGDSNPINKPWNVKGLFAPTIGKMPRSRLRLSLQLVMKNLRCNR